MRTEGEIQDWVAKKEAEYDRYREIEWDALEPKVQASVPHSAWVTCLNVATYRLVLGDASAAKPWFRRASDAIGHAALACINHPAELERLEVTNIGKHFTRSIRCALLSDDPSQVETQSEECLGVDDDEVRTLLEERGGTPSSFDECQLVAALALGRDELSAESTEKLRAASEEPNFDELYSTVPEGHTGPLLDVADGLRDDDAGEVEDALKAMLDARAKTIDGEPRGSREVMDHTAASLLVLAWGRGLDVRIDSEYLPTALTEYRE